MGKEVRSEEIYKVGSNIEEEWADESSGLCITAQDIADTIVDCMTRAINRAFKIAILVGDEDGISICDNFACEKNDATVEFLRKGIHTLVEEFEVEESESEKKSYCSKDKFSQPPKSPLGWL